MWRLVGFAMISEVHRTALIVDDHATFRDPARALLEVGGFVVVGEAADGLRALAEVELLAPTLSCSTSNFPSSTGLPSPSGLPPRPPARLWYWCRAATLSRTTTGSSTPRWPGSCRSGR